MVGENILKHPELAREVLRRGHSVGNHTFNHLKGTAKGVKEYIERIDEMIERKQKMFGGRREV